MNLPQARRMSDYGHDLLTDKWKGSWATTLNSVPANRQRGLLCLRSLCAESKQQKCYYLAHALRMKAERDGLQPNLSAIKQWTEIYGKLTAEQLDSVAEAYLIEETKRD